MSLSRLTAVPRRIRTLSLSVLALSGLVAAIVAAPAAARPTPPPCGFVSGTTATQPGGPYPPVHYTIRNCHSTTIRRAILFTDGSRSSCRTYKPNQVRTGATARGYKRLVTCK